MQTAEPVSTNWTKAAELKAGQAGVNMILNIITIQSVLRSDYSDGTELRIAHVVAGDDSGSVNLLLRDGHIDECYSGWRKGQNVIVRGGYYDFHGKGRYLEIDEGGQVLMQNDVSSSRLSKQAGNTGVC